MIQHRLSPLLDALLERHKRPAAAAAAIRTRGLRYALAPSPLPFWAAWDMEDPNLRQLEDELLRELCTPPADFFPLPAPEVLTAGQDPEPTTPVLIPVHP